MKDHSFTNLYKPGGRAIWATCGFAAAQVLFSLVNVYQNAIIQRFIDGSADIAALERSDAIITVTAFGIIGALIIAAIFNGRFLYLASRNAAIVDPDPTAIRPRWAIGWYFIPFANYIMPYRAMKQTWTRLHIDSEVPGWFIIWWLSWVVMNVFDGVMNNRTPPNNLPDYMDYNQTLIFSGFLWLIPTFFFIRIIRALRVAEHNPAEVFA